MSQAELNSELIAIVAGDVIVFNYDGETREYLSSSVEYLAAGVGIPANSCVDAPDKIKDGFTVCRTADGKARECVVDHRGEVVYSTKQVRKFPLPYRGISERYHHAGPVHTIR